MGHSIGRRIVLGFSIALALLIVVGVVSYRNLRELTEAQRSVAHTMQVLQVSESLFSHLADSASLARGYGLTGEPSLSERFSFVVREIDQDLATLRELTAGDVAERERVAQLQPLVAERIESAQRLIESRRSAQLDRENRMAVIVLQGVEVMDGIRASLSEIQATEQRLLQARQAQNDATERLTVNTLLFGTAAAFLLVGTAAYFITRGIRVPLNTLMEGATRIGGGNYAHRVAVASKDEIGELAKVFNRMAEQVEQRQTSLAEQDWLNASLATFSALLESERKQAKLCQAVLKELGAILNARHSVIYAPAPASTSVELQLQASYACDRPPALLSPGQGLVGQCFKDQELLVLREVPGDYIKINSALGASSPANLAVVPVVFDARTLAVIELATFEPLTDVQLTMLRRMANRLGIVLNIITAATRTEELLAESQVLGERLNERNHELQAQSERLRQSEQLLQEQQGELKRTNEELEQSNEELQQTNAEMEDKAVLLEEQKRAVETANREVSEARAALEEKVEQLALTSKYKSDFLANMSHELRTPLNSLLILSKMLADNADGNLTDKQVQRAQAIHSSGGDLLKLINDVLDLSKIESGSVDAESDNVRIGELTRFIDATFRHMAEGKGLEFDIEVAADAPESVVTDERRLQQILKNLLANACKFTERGSVSLRIAAAADGWRDANPTLQSANGVAAFTVTDTGIGIPPDRLQMVFESFRQGDAGTARRYGGTGLGLSISRELTRLLGGALTLHSEDGAGSVFTLYLPVQAPAPRVEPHPPLSSIPRGMSESHQAIEDAPAFADDRNLLQTDDRVLLVIEDDPQFARILADFAHEKEFKVLLAESAQAGIELARRYKPTAITLDLLLPDNDGWVVLDRLKHDPDTRHIPLHVISVEEQRERSLRLGAVSYLQKPVTGEAIEKALSRTIEFVQRRVKNLLVVEDDARQRQSIIELIGNGDVLVTAVGSAAEALEALQQERFDCMVLDLGLPDMPGTALIGEIQKRHGEASPPIVIYTGKTLTRKEETELRRVSDAIIVKDVLSPERLLAETALFLHRVQSKLPESKRRLMDMIRKDDPLLSHRKVLVVDDDVRNIFAITAALESHKMEVIYAESGQAGIELLKLHPEIDVVLMDVMMPEMDGYETIRRIRAEERFGKMPIIAVTAKAMKGDRERCLHAGASDYITKPVDMDQLRSLLRVWSYR